MNERMVIKTAKSLNREKYMLDNDVKTMANAQILKKFFLKEYSAKYIELLLKMIATEESQRVDFIGLYKMLENYY